jgi:hypothetical protein
MVMTVFEGGRGAEKGDFLFETSTGLARIL